MKELKFVDFVSFLIKSLFVSSLLCGTSFHGTERRCRVVDQNKVRKGNNLVGESWRREEYWEAADSERMRKNRKKGEKLKWKGGGRQRQRGSNQCVRSSFSVRINGN